MLQKLSYQDQAPDEQNDQFLTPEYFFDIVKRRWFYFVIPFALVLVIGALITAVLPAIYLSEGKMLIESQQIPTELVRPTVITQPGERVELLKQRIMTRDRLMAIASKYQLAAIARKYDFLTGWWKQMSATDIVDYMRERTIIKPLEIQLPQRQDRSQFIAFSVGFEHEQPQTATQVANELVTIILGEDVRARTSSALETTRFLEREQQRLESELSSTEVKIAEAKKSQTPAGSAATNSIEAQLMTLRAELILKSASYSNTHPDIKALKQKIEALDKLLAKSNNTTNNPELGFDGLTRQRDSVKKDLEGITQKLAAARLGENLERGQHSERLEILEQPTLPQKPVRPNRPKILAVVLAAAAMAGGGLVLALEMFDNTIRRNADIAKLVDSQLIVSIPYISTKTEELRQSRRIRLAAIGGFLIVVLFGLGEAIYLYLF